MVMCKQTLCLDIQTGKNLAVTWADGDSDIFKGIHRAILLSSIAKELGHDMEFSNKDGLVERESNRNIITTESC
jgi:hypothetical protein